MNERAFATLLTSQPHGSWAAPRHLERAGSSTYEVSFPLFAKIVVKGEGQHPLYATLTADQPEAKNLPESGFRAKLASYGLVPATPSEVLWNFEKFLVDRDGQVIERFAPDVPPDAPIVIAAIESALARA